MHLTEGARTTTRSDSDDRIIVVVRSPPTPTYDSISLTPQPQEGHSIMDNRLPRKLAGIFYADVAGYSRLTASDEHEARRGLTKSLDLISDRCRRIEDEWGTMQATQCLQISPVPPMRWRAPPGSGRH
jgi:hypothetical protein